MESAYYNQDFTRGQSPSGAILVREMEASRMQEKISSETYPNCRLKTEVGFKRIYGMDEEVKRDVDFTCRRKFVSIA